MMNYKSYLFVCFSIVFTFSCTTKFNDDTEIDEKAHLIDEYINKANDASLKESERITNAETAFYLLDKAEDNIEKRKRYTKISKVYYDLSDSLRFNKTIYSTIKLAKSISDSSGVAYNYNRLAIFHEKKDRLDSAYANYNRAEKIYSKIQNKGKKHDYNHGRTLMGMAIIQRQVKDYTKSISTTIDAIKKFELCEEVNKNRYLSICYSNLGIVSNNLEKYDDAIRYHEKSIEFSKELKSRKLREILAYNNIGIVYKNQKIYKEAIKYFEKALSYASFLNENPKRKSLLLDNLAYVKFLSGSKEGVLESFLEPLRIRDSVGDKIGLTTNQLHLAEYHYSIGDSLIALEYAKNAENLSSDLESNKELLESYSLLSRISEEKEGLKYARAYIRLNDSLSKEERAYRDKFALIEYETEEKEDQITQISKEKQMLIFAILGLSVLFLLGYVIFRQQQSNKELLFEQNQQQSNQEIYRLLLSQQLKLEEGRKLEQHRMSEELHDGVLGRLFGVRLSLDGINQRANDGFTESRNKYIDELKSIEKEIRLISHDLGTDTLSPDIAYVDVVESLVSDLCTVHKMDFAFANDENIDWETIDDQKKVNLFRIIQESLQNIFKHAQAESVKINFDYVDDKINLTILDDGIGFKSSKVKRGIGLKNITSRVTQMNGVVDFISNHDSGTKVSVGIPI